MTDIWLRCGAPWSGYNPKISHPPDRLLFFSVNCKQSQLTRFCGGGKVGQIFKLLTTARFIRRLKKGCYSVIFPPPPFSREQLSKYFVE